jgi:hypothetical protein
MSPKEGSKSSAASLTASDGSQPACGPGEHFDPASGMCVPDSGGAAEVSAFAENLDAVSDESKSEK